MASRSAAFLILLSTTLLAGCWTIERPAFLQSTPVSTAPSGGPPPTSLDGKWTLSAPGAGSCTMNFGAQPDATEGTIAPAGGCPFDFFTSRKWDYAAARFVIRDHRAQVLAQLSPIGPDRFEGRTSDGQDVELARAPADGPVVIRAQ